MLFCSGPATRSSQGQPCLPWQSGEFGNPAGEVSCRSLNGKGRPFCPADNNGQRSYLYCGVPHCALSVYSTSEAPRGIEDWNWGLSRIGRCGVRVPILAEHPMITMR